MSILALVKVSHPTRYPFSRKLDTKATLYTTHTKLAAPKTLTHRGRRPRKGHCIRTARKRKGRMIEKVVMRIRKTLLRRQNLMTNPLREI